MQMVMALPSSMVSVSATAAATRSAFGCRSFGSTKDQDILNADHTKAAFNTPAGVESLQWLYDLVYTHKVSPQGESDPDDDFMKGIVAMNVTGPWAMGDYNKIEGLEYRTTPLPIVYDQMAVWDHPHMLVFPEER